LGVSLMARLWPNGLAVRMILPIWFDHLEECFPYPPVKTSCPLAENVKIKPPHCT